MTVPPRPITQDKIAFHRLGAVNGYDTELRAWFVVGLKNNRGQDSLSLNEVGFLTRGRPLGRTVDYKPNRLTVDSTHSRSPKGHPLLAESRTADSSCSVSGWLTRSIQPRGLGIGQEQSKGGFGSGFWLQCQRDPQRHSSARETNSARSAFRSTYRHTVSKYLSSWIGKLLNRL